MTAVLSTSVQEQQCERGRNRIDSYLESEQKIDDMNESKNEKKHEQ